MFIIGIIVIIFSSSSFSFSLTLSFSSISSFLSFLSVAFVCFALQTLWLTFCTGIVGYFPEGNLKRWLNRHVSIMCFGVLSSALSAVITYHNVENRPKRGICVANHTSPIDVLVLACDNCYALVCHSVSLCLTKPTLHVIACHCIELCCLSQIIPHLQEK